MTIVAERVFTVAVKVEVPNVTALDDATAILHDRLNEAVPVRRLTLGPHRSDNIRIVSKSVTRG